MDNDEYEDQAVAGYNFNDRPTMGDVNQHNLGDSWYKIMTDCVNTLNHPYDEYYVRSVKPPSLTADVKSKRHRNPAAVLLGYCTYLAIMYEPASRVADEINRVCTFNDDMVHKYNVRKPDVLREYFYFENVRTNP